MTRLLARVRERLFLRKCRGNCEFDDVHTHHLTRLGLWYLTSAFRPPSLWRRITGRIGVALSLVCFIIAGFDLWAGLRSGHHGLLVAAALIGIVGALELWVDKEMRRSP